MIWLTSAQRVANERLAFSLSSPAPSASAIEERKATLNAAFLKKHFVLTMLVAVCFIALLALATSAAVFAVMLAFGNLFWEALLPGFVAGATGLGARVLYALVTENLKIRRTLLAEVALLRNVSAEAGQELVAMCEETPETDAYLMQVLASHRVFVRAEQHLVASWADIARARLERLPRMELSHS
jgi:hypothetical protein